MNNKIGLIFCRFLFLVYLVFSCIFVEFVKSTLSFFFMFKFKQGEVSQGNSKEVMGGLKSDHHFSMKEHHHQQFSISVQIILFPDFV